jgi:heme exporter protein B
VAERRVSVALAVLWKDLVSEWRDRDRAVAMAVFAFLVVLVLHFALPARDPAEVRRLAPGLLWVTYVFAALLGLNRAFALELENEALAGLALAPADRGWIFLGKAAASFVLLGAVEAAAAVVFALAFDLDLRPVALRLAGVVALASLGLVLVGTLLAAVAVRTRYREVMLPLLLLPLLVPVLLGGVEATRSLIDEGVLHWPSLQLLVVADAVYGIVSFVSFEWVLEE